MHTKIIYTYEVPHLCFQMLVFSARGMRRRTPYGFLFDLFVTKHYTIPQKHDAGGQIVIRWLNYKSDPVLGERERE